MAFDRQIIKSVTPVELARLITDTGLATVLDTQMVDGKPVIHAALVSINAQTGEALPGGLPFSVVLQRRATDKGYSNIAVGTIVPAAELGIVLPPDFFNFSNQRLRFVRVYPLDAGSFVIQYDLVLGQATREYVKFAFGLWSRLFSQILFELIGKRKDALALACEAYAAAHKPQDVVDAISPAEEAEPQDDRQPEPPAEAASAPLVTVASGVAAVAAVGVVGEEVLEHRAGDDAEVVAAPQPAAEHSDALAAIPETQAVPDSPEASVPEAGPQEAGLAGEEPAAEAPAEALADTAPAYTAPAYTAIVESEVADLTTPLPLAAEAAHPVHPITEPTAAPLLLDAPSLEADSDAEPQPSLAGPSEPLHLI